MQGKYRFASQGIEDRGDRKLGRKGGIINCKRKEKGAFYAFPNIEQTGWKAKALASALLEEAGVALIGGPDFGIYGEGYIRVSYANSTENIREAIGRIRGFLENNSKTTDTLDQGRQVDFAKLLAAHHQVALPVPKLVAVGDDLRAMRNR